MITEFQAFYFLSAVTFSSVNFLNVTYAFLKRFIEKDFHMTSTEIGIADALKFFGTIVGLFMYISLGSLDKKKVPYVYCLSISLNALFMGFIPFLSIFGWNEKWIVFVFNFLGGMVKAPSWPLLLQLVKDTIFRVKPNAKPLQQVTNEAELETQKSSNSKQNGKRFIVWTSLTLLGNILGLVLCEALIYQTNMSWKVCLLLPSFCIVVFAFLMYVYTLKNPNFFLKEDEQLPSAENHVSQQPHSTLEMVLKCLKMLFLTKDCIFIWSLVTLLSIHSIMMIFLPLFLFKIGYHHYEGYILAWYNIWVIIGTYGFTCINFNRIFRFQFLIMPKNQPELQLQEENKDFQLEEMVRIKKQAVSKQNSLQIANFLSLSLLLLACIVLVSLPCPYNCAEITLLGEIDPQKLDHNYNVIWYFFILGLVGLFLGGPLNKYESIELLEVLKEYEQILSQKGHFTKLNTEKSENSKTEDQKRGFKTLIGIIQLTSYLTVMMVLIPVGHIIEIHILGFFYFISILAGFLFILEVIKIGDRRLSS